MRIIAGQCKGKKLFSPADIQIRPTSDRMREAIFNILGDTVSDAYVLDLFAGTGALGLEALSRGAMACSFVDVSATAASLLQRNIEACRMKEKASVYVKNATESLVFLSRTTPFTLVFIDPPYHTYDITTLLTSLHSHVLLGTDAVVVIETGSTEDVIVPKDLFELQKERRYGKSKVSFLHYLV